MEGKLGFMDFLREVKGVEDKERERIARVNSKERAERDRVVTGLSRERERANAAKESAVEKNMGELHENVPGPSVTSNLPAPYVSISLHKKNA